MPEEEHIPAPASDQISTEPPTDPYVVYQLRKPSQRGTAVIPRFVPNTHAPAFSPANYRFARVWATSESGTALPSSTLLHVPRSFEYAPSLGSESSFWSDTSSSWVSVSSQRTTPSDARQSILHTKTSPVSAAAFFKAEFQQQQSDVLPVHRSHDGIFAYPPALSESVSEDAVIDDLLATPRPQFPTLHTPPSSAAPLRHRPANNYASTSQHLAAAPAATSPSTRPSPPPPPHHHHHHQHHHSTSRSPDTPRGIPPSDSLRQALPFLTRKRRSLWQWLFCTDAATGSTTAASLEAPPQRKKSTPTAAAATDRVPARDREFLHRANKAPDARPKRVPSFEIRRGKPDREKGYKRSLSWNFVTKAVRAAGGDTRRRRPAPPSTQPPPVVKVQQSEKTSKPKKKKVQKQKDRPRGIVIEDERPGSHHLRFQRSSSSKLSLSHSKRGEDKRDPRESRKPRRAADTVIRNNGPKDRPRADRPREDRPREDRPREDRPRQPAQCQKNESVSAAPVQKSVVPSLREKKGTAGHVHGQRMRSVESAEQIASRISSDLSSGIERSIGSGASTPTQKHQFTADGHDLDPAANGVSSDVSSHVSGGQEKSSPVEQKIEPEAIEGPVGFAPPMDFSPINVQQAQTAAFRSDLFAFPSTSTESTGLSFGAAGVREWQKQASMESDVASAHGKTCPEQTPELASLTDPVARAREKNRARSAGGGPLSYLMRNSEPDDADTQSTGLTSLADESVSTHKTVSGVDDYKGVMGYAGSSRYRYRDSKKSSRHFHEMSDDISDGSGPGRPGIFKNSGLFDPTGAVSPGRVSSSASPRRFHSDWSDPHATDIDVYCQCSCNCVYEEECRRTCELVYGRSSPSVSSSRSCSRRGYPGFQTLPPAMGADMRYANMSPNAIENSRESHAHVGPRGDGGRTGFENRGRSTQKSYTRSSGMDELLGSKANGVGESTLQAYVSDESVRGPYDVRVGHGHQRDGHNSSSGRKHRVELHTDDRRGDTSRDGRTSRTSQRHGGVHQDNRSPQSRGHPRDASRSGKRPSSSPRYGSGSRIEGNTVPREHRSRTSSRNTAGSGSSRQSSGVSKMQENTSSGKRRDFSDEIAGERKRRDAEDGTRHEHGTLESRQQMGNNYIVKKDGRPSFNQAQMPPPYQASGYGREVSYDYDEGQGLGGDTLDGAEWPAGTYSRRSPVGYDQPPVVELEFETRGIGGSPDPHAGRTRNGEKYRSNRHGSSSSRHHRKGESGHHASRHSSSGGNRTPKGESRAGSKHAKVSSRQSSKTSSRSRTPLFGRL